MKQIDILTSNNVTIQYELASVMQRFLALLIDSVIILFYSIICYWLIIGIFLNSFDFELAQIIYYIIIFPVITFYNLICEIFFNGQTIGKKALQIKVVKITGENATIGDYFIRWTYRLVDILMSAGAIAAIFVSSSEKSQRLGDLAANTAVIKLNPDNKYTIRDILKIAKHKDYIPLYTQVTQLSDNDMLLIKNSLDRVKKFPNEANKKVILKLIKKISITLNIDEVPKNKIQFLKTLLKDYIILTR
jgi:uncharacterized RDD family membrane protein YckC